MSAPLIATWKPSRVVIVTSHPRVGGCTPFAIPGAKHLEWIDLIDKQTQRFKAADQLRTLFAAAEIKLDRPTATHCQGGGRAAVMAFGMELMGASSVANYYASWGEWGNADDTPIVPGKPTKKP